MLVWFHCPLCYARVLHMRYALNEDCGNTVFSSASCRILKAKGSAKWWDLALLICQVICTRKLVKGGLENELFILFLKAILLQNDVLLSLLSFWE